MNEMIKRKKDEGFTLIELMIVIAVIGILAVVLVPKMGNVKTTAKLTGVTTNFRSVSTALQGVTTFTDNDSVATYLQSTFLDTGANALTNPITSSKVISDDEATAGAVISDSGATTPTTSTTNYPGTIVVKPSLTAGVGSVTIYACDDKGNLMKDLSIVINY